MGMTIQKLKEEGKYLGHSKEFGYVYKLEGNLYSYSRNGIQRITNKEIVL